MKIITQTVYAFKSFNKNSIKDIRDFVIETQDNSIYYDKSNAQLNANVYDEGRKVKKLSITVCIRDIK